MNSISKTRYDRLIKPHVEGESVLNLGCVQHDASNRTNEGWQHGLIEEDADEVLGMDVLEDEVNILQNEGYNVVTGDAQNFDLGQTFDVVVVGELIEHLDDFGGLFRSIRNHLTDDGKVIITTPNGRSVAWSWSIMLNGGDIVNDEHTCWLDETTLQQLLDRYNFKVTDVMYQQMTSFFAIRTLTGAGMYVLEHVLPERVAARNMAVVARPV
jgi:2-polyprenyl-3-methyl-5-hydroxy-6-metoxy-1,4-benzoquinol methylase